MTSVSSSNLEQQQGGIIVPGDSEMRAERPREGQTTKAIERATGRIPSSTFLWLASGSIAASLALQMSGRREMSLFVGQWAPTFLLLGIYNKLVKTVGSE